MLKLAEFEAALGLDPGSTKVLWLISRKASCVCLELTRTWASCPKARRTPLLLSTSMEFVAIFFVIRRAAACISRTGNLVAASLVVLSSAQAAVTFSPVAEGHFSVPVFVNGTGPYPFILDTGADSSGVYQWFADQARLPRNGTETSDSGMTSTISVPEYRIRTFEMDGHKINNMVAYALPSRHHSGGLAGVLGNDFMDKTVTVFDFPCRRVEVLSNPAAAPAVAGKGLPPIAAYRVAGETLLSFPIRLNGAEGVALLDTGNRVHFFADCAAKKRPFRGSRTQTSREGKRLGSLQKICLAPGHA